MAQEELKIAGMKLKIDGAAQFQSDLNTCKTTSKSLKDELKVLEAGTTSAGKNGAEYLRLQSQSLTSALINQEKNTLKLKDALANTTDAYGKDSKEVTKLENEVTKSRIAEEKLKVSLQNNNSELAKAENVTLKAANQMKELGDKAKATGTTLNNTGNALTAGITAPAIAAAAALAALTIKNVESADTIQLAADKYGMTTDRIQELTYAGKGLDVEFDTMASSQSKLIKAMTAARLGTEAQKTAFDSLGISVVNSDGSLRDSNVVWGEVIDKLGQMPNETEASATALILLGKSAMDLNPLIRAGSSELAKLSVEAHTAGAVMSGENVAALDEFGDSVEKAKVAIGTAAGEITVKMLPTLEKILPIVTDKVVPAIGDFAEGIGGLIEWFDNLNPIAKTMITNAASYLILAGPTLKIIGSMVGLYGTYTGAMAANTIAQEMKNAKEAEGAVTAAANTAAEAAKTGVIATETVATEALTVAETTATTAGLGLSAVLGPIAIAIAAVGVAAYGAYNIIDNMSGDASKSVQELSDACNSSAKSFATSSAETKANATVTRNLSTELYALADKENKSSAEKTKMAGIVSQLNKLVPDLGLAIDSQTGSLNKNKEATDSLIESKLKEIQLQASEERLLELYKERAKLEEEMSNAEAALSEANQKSIVDNLAEFTGAMMSGKETIYSYTSAQADATATAKLAKDSLAKVTEEVGKAESAYSSETTKMQGNTAAAKDSTAATDSTGKAIKSATATTESHVLMLTKDAQALNAVTKASRDLEIAAKATDAVLVSSIDHAGVYASELWDNAPEFKDGLAAAELRAKAEYAASNYADGLTGGLIDKGKSVEAAGYALADAAANAYNKGMEINSPSRRMKRAAGFTVDGLIDQFKAREPDIAAASLRLANVSARNMTVTPAVSLSARSANAASSSAAVTSGGLSIDYVKLGAAVAAAMPKSDLTGFTMQLDGRTVGRLIRGTI